MRPRSFRGGYLTKEMAQALIERVYGREQHIEIVPATDEYKELCTYLEGRKLTHETAMYLRISSEDEDLRTGEKNESESISNQRSLLGIMYAAMQIYPA